MSKIILFTIISLFMLSSCSLDPIQTQSVKSYQILPDKYANGKSKDKATKNLKILIVQNMTAEPPFNSNQMLYSNSKYNIKAYSFHQWITSANNMLSNTISQYLTDNLRGITTVSGNYLGYSNYSLSSDLQTLKQKFNGNSSKVILRIALRLTNTKTGIIISTKNILVQINASPNPQGMIKSTNIAANTAAQEITIWLNSTFNSNESEI